MATFTPVLIVGQIPVDATGGSPFDNGKTYTGIRSMKIGHGDIVVSICTEYEKNGQFVWSSKHGTNNGTRTVEIKLDYPDEFLEPVSGTSTVEFPTQHLVIQTLTIQSNKKTYGPSTSIGPFGGAGVKFDDGTYPSIMALGIRYGEGFVSMQTRYATADGQNHWSEEHGYCKAGGTIDYVSLDPDEYLISLSGYYHIEGSNHVVHSLTFQSNKLEKKYGPYGTTDGIYFSISTPIGLGLKIVGFYGVSAEYINSIFAHFGPLS